MCIESKAGFTTYNTGYAQPQISDTSGYLEISCYSPSRSNRLGYVFMWSQTGDTGEDSMLPYVDITLSADTVNFKANGSSYFTLLVWALDGTSSPATLFNGVPDPYNGYTYDFWDDYQMDSYHVYGNIGSINASNINAYESFSVVYGSDFVLQSKLDELAELLREGNTGGAVPGLLEEGNQLQQEQNDLQKEENELQKESNDQQKGFFDNFFGNLVDSIIGIFVPSSEELSELFDRLNQFFSDTFGFLYYPFEFIIKAFDVFLNSDSSTGLTFPSFSIMGYEVWGDLTYDIGAEGVAGDIFGYVRIGTGAILGIAFVNYLRSFFDKRFGGGGN